MNQMHIVTVDDNPSVLHVITGMLEVSGYRVSSFLDPEEAIHFCQQEDVDLMVSDFYMPQMDGLDLLTSLKERALNIPFIILTGSNQCQRLSIAAHLGAKILFKPMGMIELLDHIELKRDSICH